MSTPVAILALRPTGRALPVRFSAGSALLALVAVLVLHDVPAAGLLAGAFFLAAAAAPVLEDPAHATLGPSPTPRWVRRSVRLGLTLPALSLCWLLLLVVAGLVTPADPGLPVAATTWRWVGMVAVVLAASGAAQALALPSFDGGAGVAGLIGVLVADVIVQRLWPKLGLFLIGDPAVSTRLEVRMAVLVMVAVVAIAATARDPAR